MIFVQFCLQTLIKTRLTIKLLLLVSVSLSLSQQYGIERKRPKSIVKKPVSIKEIIRYGERGSNAQGEVHQKNRSFVSNPFLPMKVSTDTSLRKTKMLSSTPINKEADNNTGRAIVCGTKNFLLCFHSMFIRNQKGLYNKNT